MIRFLGVGPILGGWLGRIPLLSPCRGGYIHVLHTGTTAALPNPGTHLILPRAPLTAGLTCQAFCDACGNVRARWSVQGFGTASGQAAGHCLGSDRKGDFGLGAGSRTIMCTVWITSNCSELAKKTEPMVRCSNHTVRHRLIAMPMRDPVLPE